MSNDVPGMHSQEGPLINWQYLWMITKRHYLLFFAIFIPVIGATVAYLMVTKPVYQSIAVVKVLQRDTGAIRTSSDPTEDLTSADAVQTIEQSMQSYDLFQAVVKTPRHRERPPIFWSAFTAARTPPPPPRTSPTGWPAM